MNFLVDFWKKIDMLYGVHVLVILNALFQFFTFFLVTCTSLGSPCCVTSRDPDPAFRSNPNGMSQILLSDWLSPTQMPLPLELNYKSKIKVIIFGLGPKKCLNTFFLILV